MQRGATLLAAALLPLCAAAQAPALAGRMGDKALIVIDGRARTLGLGQTVQPTSGLVASQSYVEVR